EAELAGIQDSQRVERSLNRAHGLEPAAVLALHQVRQANADAVAVLDRAAHVAGERKQLVDGVRQPAAGIVTVRGHIHGEQLRPAPDPVLDHPHVVTFEDRPGCGPIIQHSRAWHGDVDEVESASCRAWPCTALPPPLGKAPRDVVSALPKPPSFVLSDGLTARGITDAAGPALLSRPPLPKALEREIESRSPGAHGSGAFAVVEQGGNQAYAVHLDDCCEAILEAFEAVSAQNAPFGLRERSQRRLRHDAEAACT